MTMPAVLEPDTQGRATNFGALRHAFLACTLLTLVLVVSGGSLPAVALGVFLAPWVEETVFRLGLQEALWRREVVRPVRVAVVALLFSAAHAWHHGLSGAAAVFLPGLLLGMAYERHRSLALCVALHAAMNVAAAAGAWWIPGRPW
jgi:membrane protease YdiL (CAAX protease family)